ncbi:RNA 2',3'-cyclic phosphodiesterase [Nanoarchaeota archaeon]
MDGEIRSFISIDIPEEVRKEISGIQEKLPEFVGKKTELENLHLTLKFLGGIDDDKLKKVREKLKEISFNKFNVEIDLIGIFSETFIRIIWLHLTDCDKLQKEIDNALIGLFDKEKRFMSHLTIARVKYIENKKEFLKKLDKIKIPKISFAVDNFKLKKSTLIPKGPIYDDIEIYTAR